MDLVGLNEYGVMYDRNGDQFERSTVSKRPCQARDHPPIERRSRDRQDQDNLIRFGRVPTTVHIGPGNRVWVIHEQDRANHPGNSQY